MKDSGFQWIGDLPKNWNITRFRYVYDIKKAKLPSVLYDNQELTTIPYLTMEYIRDSSITPRYSLDGTYCKEDNLLLLWDGSNAGEVIYSHPSGFAPSTTALLINKSRNSNRFSKYYMMLLETKLRENTNGMGIPHVNSLYLRNLPFIEPSINEQEIIASFLDIKCSNIDSIINDLERQIEILEKYKKSVITEAVTKGLNPDIDMKESGVEWIGKIPVNWKVMKLKYVLSSPLQYGANETGIDFSDELPRYIRITDISMDNKLKEEGKLSLDFNVAKQYILMHNDILFARSGATVGKTFLYLESYGLCCFAGYLIRANINNKIVFPKYVYYTTLGNGYENWKDKVFSQATIQNIGADKYNLYKLPIPTLEEQVDIINHIDSKCSEIDSIIEDKKCQVETIKKYKNSLIYEYVTGKKRVSQGDVNE